MEQVNYVPGVKAAYKGKRNDTPQGRLFNNMQLNEESIYAGEVFSAGVRMPNKFWTDIKCLSKDEKYKEVRFGSSGIEHVRMTFMIYLTDLGKGLLGDNHVHQVYTGGDVSGLMDQMLTDKRRNKTTKDVYKLSSVDAYWTWVHEESQCVWLAGMDEMPRLQKITREDKRTQLFADRLANAETVRRSIFLFANFISSIIHLYGTDIKESRGIVTPQPTSNETAYTVNTLVTRMMDFWSLMNKQQTAELQTTTGISSLLQNMFSAGNFSTTNLYAYYQSLFSDTLNPEAKKLFMTAIRGFGETVDRVTNKSTYSIHVGSTPIANDELFGHYMKNLALKCNQPTVYTGNLLSFANINAICEHLTVTVKEPGNEAYVLRSGTNTYNMQMAKILSNIGNQSRVGTIDTLARDYGTFTLGWGNGDDSKVSKFMKILPNIYKEELMKSIPTQFEIPTSDTLALLFLSLIPLFNVLHQYDVTVSKNNPELSKQKYVPLNAQLSMKLLIIIIAQAFDIRTVDESTKNGIPSSLLADGFHNYSSYDELRTKTGMDADKRRETWQNIENSKITEPGVRELERIIGERITLRSYGDMSYTKPATHITYNKAMHAAAVDVLYPNNIRLSIFPRNEKWYVRVRSITGVLSTDWALQAPSEVKGVHSKNNDEKTDKDDEDDNKQEPSAEELGSYAHKNYRLGVDKAYKTDSSLTMEELQNRMAKDRREIEEEIVVLNKLMQQKESGDRSAQHVGYNPSLPSNSSRLVWKSNIFDTIAPIFKIPNTTIRYDTGNKEGSNTTAVPIYKLGIAQKYPPYNFLSNTGVGISVLFKNLLYHLERWYEGLNWSVNGQLLIECAGNQVISCDPPMFLSPYAPDIHGVSYFFKHQLQNQLVYFQYDTLNDLSKSENHHITGNNMQEKGGSKDEHDGDGDENDKMQIEATSDVIGGSPSVIKGKKLTGLTRGLLSGDNQPMGDGTQSCIEGEGEGEGEEHGDQPNTNVDKEDDEADMEEDAIVVSNDEAEEAEEEAAEEEEEEVEENKSMGVEEITYDKETDKDGNIDNYMDIEQDGGNSNEHRMKHKYRVEGLNALEWEGQLISDNICSTLNEFNDSILKMRNMLHILPLIQMMGFKWQRYLVFFTLLKRWTIRYVELGHTFVDTKLTTLMSRVDSLTIEDINKSCSEEKDDGNILLLKEIEEYMATNALIIFAKEIFYHTLAGYINLVNWYNLVSVAYEGDKVMSFMWSAFISYTLSGHIAEHKFSKGDKKWFINTMDLKEKGDTKGKKKETTDKGREMGVLYDTSAFGLSNSASEYLSIVSSADGPLPIHPFKAPWTTRGFKELSHVVLTLGLWQEDIYPMFIRSVLRIQKEKEKTLLVKQKEIEKQIELEKQKAGDSKRDNQVGQDNTEKKRTVVGLIVDKDKGNTTANDLQIINRFDLFSRLSGLTTYTSIYSQDNPDAERDMGQLVNTVQQHNKILANLATEANHLNAQSERIREAMVGLFMAKARCIHKMGDMQGVKKPIHLRLPTSPACLPMNTIVSDGVIYDMEKVMKEMQTVGSIAYLEGDGMYTRTLMSLWLQQDKLNKETKTDEKGSKWQEGMDGIIKKFVTVVNGKKVATPTKHISLLTNDVKWSHEYNDRTTALVGTKKSNTNAGTDHTKNLVAPVGSIKTDPPKVTTNQQKVTTNTTIQSSPSSNINMKGPMMTGKQTTTSVPVSKVANVSTGKNVSTVKKATKK